MARKTSKHSRAQMRSRFRKPRRRRSGSVVWGVAVALVFVLGVGAVAMARGDRDASADVAPRPPSGDRPFDHWHAYLGIDACGQWLSNWPEFHVVAGSPNVQTGIHSHADGNVHVHPLNRSESGNNATLGRFVSNGGGNVSSSSITLWDGTELRDGDTCEAGEFAGEEAVFQWTVDGEVQDGNPADHKLENGEVIAIYLLPEGAELTEPPGADFAVANPIDLQPPGSGPGVGDDPAVVPDGLPDGGENAPSNEADPAP